jgi:hypothetical protein
LWTASNGATTRTITAPAQSKAYVVINAGTGSIIIKGSGTVSPYNGVTITSGYKALVAWNGTDFVKIAGGLTSLTTDVTGTLPVGNGGTGVTTLTGIAKGNGSSAFSAAVAGTDYAAATSGTSILYGNGAGGFSNVTVGSNLSFVGGTLSTTGLGSGSVTSVAAGTGMSFSTITTTGSVAIDTAVVARYGATGTFTSAQIFSGGATFSGSATFTGGAALTGTSSVAGTTVQNALETVNIQASAPSATLNVYMNNGGIQMYTSNAANNWAANLAFSSGTSMNSALTTGQAITVAVAVKQGATGYYNSSVQVDGTTSGVTTYWQNGNAPSFGNPLGYDIYTYTVVKTGSAAYTVFATQAQF